MGESFSPADEEATHVVPSAEPATQFQSAPGTLFDLQLAPELVEL
jgi:hypothetical protein